MVLGKKWSPYEYSRLLNAATLSTFFIAIIGSLLTHNKFQMAKGFHM